MGRRGLIGYVEAWRLPPQAFNVVKEARAFEKNMNDEAAVIEQDPFRGVVPFAMKKTAMRAIERFLDSVGDGLNLPLAESGADQKGAGKRAEAGEVEHGDACGFAILGGGDGGAKFRALID